MLLSCAVKVKPFFQVMVEVYVRSRRASKKRTKFEFHLLGRLRERHASERRGQRFRIHFAPGTLEVIVLPRLHVRRLQFHQISDKREQHENEIKNRNKKTNKIRSIIKIKTIKWGQGRVKYN